MLRRSELAALTVGSIKELAGGGIGVQVARSKMDQQGAGVLVCLAEWTASGVPIGKIVRRHLGFTGERSSETPLFMRGARTVAWERASFTNRLRWLIKELQQALPSLSGDVTSLSAHSLRRGGATAARPTLGLAWRLSNSTGDGNRKQCSCT